MDANALHSNPRPQRVTCLQVYEMVLQTALTEQRCGARNLPLTGSWRWLLREVRTFQCKCCLVRMTRLRPSPCTCEHDS